MGMSSAIVAGASGLVGGYLLEQLCDDAEVARVTSAGRRALERSHAKLAQSTVDFATLAGSTLPAADVAFCALGTTMKKAGSEAAFRAVDHDAVLAFARAVHAGGTTRFVMVSALGADAGARTFYNRVKGEAEDALRAVGFASLAILQPSLLLGDRAESRPGERAAIVVSRALRPLLSPFGARPIEAGVVARAMIALGRAGEPGARVYPSGELQKLGAAAR